MMISETKIGLLIPQSKQYPGLDRDFVRGVRLSGLKAKYFVESIGLGADDQLIIDKIQKLSFQEDIKVVIAFFGHRNMENVYAYTAEHNILLIVSDLGATLPYTIAKKRGVYINSLGLTESSFLLGNFFSREKKYRNIVTSSSYYDAGYGIQSAIELSLYQNNAQFSGHYITPFYPRENEAECMIASIRSFEPDAVFAFHSGLYAEEHASFIDVNQLTRDFPFYLTTFSINDKIIQQYGSVLNDVFVVGSWLEGIQDEKDCTFTKEYQLAHQSSPNSFSLLGYESGLVVKNLLETCGEDPQFHVLEAKISEIGVDGPRGNIRFQPETNRTVYDHYIYRLTVDAMENKTMKQIEVLKNDGRFIREIIDQNPPEQIGGWHNAYLCH